MTVFNAPGPFLRLSYPLLAAGLSRSLHEIENDKAAYTNFIKGSSEMASKLRTTRTRLTLSCSDPKRRIHFQSRGRLCAFKSPALDKTLRMADPFVLAVRRKRGCESLTMNNTSL